MCPFCLTTSTEYHSALTLKELRYILWDVRAKWFSIGLEFDVDPGTLMVCVCVCMCVHV